VFAVEAPLHLLKLLPGNAHTNRLPARADGQKQKRRDEFGRGVRENFRLNGLREPVLVSTAGAGWLALRG